MPIVDDDDILLSSSPENKHLHWREFVGIEPTLPAFGRQHRI